MVRGVMPSARLREAAAVLLLFALAFFVRQRVSNGWHFAGSDTYGYLRIADEWRSHGRYSTGSTDPLHFSRMPLYPLFIVIAKGEARADMKGGEGWERILVAQRWLDLLVACPLIYLIARRWGGIGAGLGALALAALWPMTVLFTATALTESPATTLTVATVAPLLLGDERPHWRFFVTGLLIGASTLLRPDGILLWFAVPPALYALRATLQPRQLAGVAALCAAGFLLIYAPWPMRNVMRSGQPYWLGGRVDRFTRPLEHYQGFWSYLKTWAPDNGNQMGISTCFYTLPCQPDLRGYPEMAFDSPEERATVEKLMALRAREGLSQKVSDGFEALAAQRRRHHWLRTEVWHPLLRAWRMWVADHGEVLQGRQPWPEVIVPLRRAFEPLSGIFFVSLMAAGIWLLRRQATRFMALTLLVPLVARTLILPHQLYSMPRYSNEVMPFGFILISVAAALLLGQARAYLTARRRA
jgi:hypothetical protein